MRRVSSMLLLAAALCPLAALYPLAARAQDSAPIVRAQDSALIVNVWPQQIHMQTDFSGARVLVFGSIDTELAPVDDVLQLAVTLSGPQRLYQLRRREKLGPIWINGAPLVRAEGPGFYALASSAPLAALAPLAVRQRHQIGLDTLFAPAAAPPRPDDDWRAALLQHQGARALYTEEFHRVRIIRNQLFRAELEIPAGAPGGSYQLSVYLLHRGRLIGRQSQPLHLVPAGLEQRLRRLAQDAPFLYGLVAILLAIVWGGLSALLPQRRRRTTPS